MEAAPRLGAGHGAMSGCVTWEPSRWKQACAAARRAIGTRQGEQLMLVTDQGKMIRTSVADIRVMGRNTQGVTIFRVADNEHVVSVAKIDESDEEEIEAETGDELAPEEGAVTGESELDRPADPEPEE